ncbi:hypothetical protein BHE74_00014263 [Ensete ventricosum]|nr:hypothetical protein BHE74_00014263 [Ensete ventricosum]RZR99588.1 hypothetical protein BHM03_00029164 [Ensete ventricosum]
MGSPPLLDHPASYAVVGGGKCTGPQPSGHRQVAPTIPLLPNTNSSPPRMDSPLPPPCHSFPRSTGSRCPIHPVRPTMHPPGAAWKTPLPFSAQRAPPRMRAVILRLFTDISRNYVARAYGIGDYRWEETTSEALCDSPPPPLSSSEVVSSMREADLWPTLSARRAAVTRVFRLPCRRGGPYV